VNTPRVRATSIATQTRIVPDELDFGFGVALVTPPVGLDIPLMISNGKIVWIYELSSNQRSQGHVI